MNLADCRNLTNRFQDVHLISLRTWKLAATIEPRDNGGPYLVSQEGFDPHDPTVTPDEFLLGRNGAWISTKLFFQLPREVRQPQYIFGTAAEVISLMSSLPAQATVVRLDGHPEATVGAEDDDLGAAFGAGKQAGAAQP